MTGVDLDRLADFVGGALDGTPDADAVRNLIATDADWAAAHAELVIADAAVRADLTRLAVVPAPMPDDVAARLTAALPTRTPERRRTSAAHERARSRWARWSAPLAAAATVLAVVAGLTYFLPRSGLTGGNSRQADAPALSTGGGATVQGDAAGSAVPRIASGRNYQPGRFGDLSAPGAAGAPGAYTAPANPAAPPRASDKGGSRSNADTNKAQEGGPPVPAELSRLTAPDALSACLAAVRAAHGGTVTLVDYARFADRPALVVVLSGSRTGGSGGWIVVVGPACGAVPGDADQRYSGPAAG